MRIFQALAGSANGAVPRNQTWHRNLYEPLIELGHDVCLFSLADGPTIMRTGDDEARADLSQRLLSSFLQYRQGGGVDLFFSYLMDGMVDPGVIDDIRRSGVPTCNFSCNNVHQFNLVRGLSQHFDYNLHAEKNVAQKFREIGARPMWWPMASNPTYFHPRDVSRDVAVSFVGANYALRAKYVANLLEDGIDVHAFGPEWQWGHRSAFRSTLRHYRSVLRVVRAWGPERQHEAAAKLADHDLRRNLGARFPGHVHPPVSDDELIALYSRSQISLGFTEVYDDHDPSRVVTRHVHLREFEAPMSGALYCTGYLDELAEMFTPETEVVTYRSYDELLEKVRYYLSHEEAAAQVRKAGRRRALADHTYQKRFRALFRTLGLNAASIDRSGALVGV
jgi:spore maturation protein CgeB